MMELKKSEQDTLMHGRTPARTRMPQNDLEITATKTPRAEFVGDPALSLN